METFPIEILPRGTRWPWYPRYACIATKNGTAVNAQGETSFTYTVVGKMSHGRIGLRRWIKIKVRAMLDKR